MKRNSYGYNSRERGKAHLRGVVNIVEICILTMLNASQRLLNVIQQNEIRSRVGEYIGVSVDLIYNGYITRLIEHLTKYRQVGGKCGVGRTSLK